MASRLIENIVECKVNSNAIAYGILIRLIENIVECKGICCAVPVCCL